MRWFNLIFLGIALLGNLQNTLLAAEPSNQIYGPVTAKETLSEIAQQVRGEWRIPLKYVVQAMYELNPQAFTGQDINSLHIGSLLIVPDMETLIREVPELLSEKPVPVHGTPGTKAVAPVSLPANSELDKTSKLLEQQVEQINKLVDSNQRNIDALKKLINHSNNYHKQVSELRSEQNTLARKLTQRIDKLEKSIQSIDNRPVQSPPAAPSTSITSPIPGIPWELSVWILFSIPLLLAITAIVLNRKASPAQVVTMEQTEQEQYTHKHLQEDRTPSSEDVTQLDPPDAGTPASTEIPPSPPPVAESLPVAPDPAPSHSESYESPPASTIMDAEEDQSASEEDILDNLAEELTEIDEALSDDEPPANEIDINELSEEMEASVATPPDDESTSVELPEISDEPAIDDGQNNSIDLDSLIEEDDEEEEDTIPGLQALADDADDPSIATQKINDEIEKLKTDDDIIEAKITTAHLHLDMGNSQQAEKTLDEINLEEHPSFTNKVNQVRELLMQKPEEPEQPVPQPQQSPPTVNSPANAVAEPADKQQEALERTLQQQLKLATNYYKQGNLTKCKVYIAKILRKGTPKYREQALNLLRKLESKSPISMTPKSGSIEFADLEDQTVLTSPQAKPENQAYRDLEKTDFHNIIPSDLSSKLAAYSDDEDGTKLGLAYLFLDLDEVETARQLLEEVAVCKDSRLVAEAHMLLEHLVIP